MKAETGNKVGVSVKHLAAWVQSLGIEVEVKIKKKRAKKGKKYPTGVQTEEERDISEIRFEYAADSPIDENLIFKLLQKTISGHHELTVTLDPAPQKKCCVAYAIKDTK